MRAPKCNLNDTITWVRNRDAAYKVRMFNDAHYSGLYQTVGTLTSVSPVRYNDKISSYCWIGGSLC